MLESNPPRNSQLETHPNDELGRRPCGRRPDHLDRFPHAFQTPPVKSPRSGILVFSSRVLRKLSKRSKRDSFKRPWLHFLEVSHSSGRGFSAGFRGCGGSWRGAFAVGLAVDDELQTS